MLRKICVLVLLIITLNSCYNDPEFLGNNLIPNEDIYAIKTDTLFELSAYTLSQDSLNTYLATEGIFGYVNSEIFGSTKGSFVGRFLPIISEDGYGGLTAKPDSIFFYFKPNSFYGDSTIPLTIRVHELLNTDITNKNYNGLKSIDGQYNPEALFTATYTGGSELKVPLDTSFARLLMDSTALADTTVFFSKFKGFFITCDDLPGYGGVAYPHSYSSFYMVLYYHYNKLIDGVDSTISTNKGFSFYNNFFYNYQHDRTKADPSKSIQHLDDTLTQDSVFYIQGTGGVYGKIRLDGLKHWVDSMPVIIHRAELIVGKDSPQTISPDSVVNQLLFYYKENNEWAGLILDQQSSSITKNNGRIRLYSQDYNVNITSHLQRVLEGEIKDSSIYVFPNSKSTISRAVLQSGNHSRKMKLKLTYTKLR